MGRAHGELRGTAVLARAARRGLAERGLRVRRQDAAGLHPERRPRPARPVDRVPRRPQAGHGRDRGRALLQAQGRRLRGHHPRRGQERDRQGQDGPGRLDPDDAARAPALHAGRHPRRPGRLPAQDQGGQARARPRSPVLEEVGRRQVSELGALRHRPAASPRSAPAPRRGCTSTSRSPSSRCARPRCSRACRRRRPSIRRCVNPQGTKARRNEVLGKMAELGYITARAGRAREAQGPRAEHEEATFRRRASATCSTTSSPSSSRSTARDDRRSAAASRSTRRSTSRSSRKRARRSRTGWSNVGPSSAIVSM